MPFMQDAGAQSKSHRPIVILTSTGKTIRLLLLPQPLLLEEDYVTARVSAWLAGCDRTGALPHLLAHSQHGDVALLCGAVAWHNDWHDLRKVDESLGCFTMRGDGKIYRDTHDYCISEYTIPMIIILLRLLLPDIFQTICTTNAVGDEHHCVLNRPHFRDKLFQGSHSAMRCSMWMASTAQGLEV